MKKVFFTSLLLEKKFLKNIFPNSKIRVGFGDKIKKEVQKEAVKSKNFLAINFGISGAKYKKDLGGIFVINKIYNKKKSFYPEILFSNKFRESSVQSFDKTILRKEKSKVKANLVDMESEHFFLEAKKYLPLENILIIKIATDSLNFAKEKEIIKILDKNKNTLDEIVRCFEEFYKKNEKIEIGFSNYEKDLINKLFDLGYFTFSLKLKLKNELNKLKILSGKNFSNYLKKVKKINSNSKKELAKKMIEEIENLNNLFD